MLSSPRAPTSLILHARQRQDLFMLNRLTRWLQAPPEAKASLVLMSEGRELPSHPLLSLLARPNGREGGQRFLETLYGHLMVSGNAYVEAVAVDGSPRELHALRPDRMRVVPGADGWPAAYDYTVGSETIRFVQRAGESVPPV